jgi:hypothetical protein
MRAALVCLSLVLCGLGLGGSGFAAQGSGRALAPVDLAAPSLCPENLVRACTSSPEISRGGYGTNGILPRRDAGCVLERGRVLTGGWGHRDVGLGLSRAACVRKWGMCVCVVPGSARSVCSAFAFGSGGVGVGALGAGAV